MVAGASERVEQGRKGVVARAGCLRHGQGYYGPHRKAETMERERHRQNMLI